MHRLLGNLLLACCAFFLMSPGSISQTSNPSSAPRQLAGAIQFAFTDVIEPVDEFDPTAPILLIGGADNPFSSYYPEILKAEGLNAFTTMRAQDVTAEALADRRVVVLVSSHLPTTAIVALDSWVRDGGVLIAMRPQGPLLQLLGLKRSQSDVLRNAYLLASPSLEMSRGLVDQPIQIHAEALRYEPLSQTDAPVAVAQLYADATAPLPNPAVAVRRIGRGYGAAFAFDLARSVALTRQGNPLWAGDERDGSLPRRPNDMFFPDYVNLDKIGVPQADEQQRLLANLILSTSGAPLPRFWYLPGGKRAAIIMAGDDHATPGDTAKLFDRLAALSPQGCRLEAWECLRATAYITLGTSLSAAQAETYRKMGFELAAHVDTGCRNQDDVALSATVQSQLLEFRRKYADLPPQATHRIHCIVWNGWADVPRIERLNGVRLDLNYYPWPPSWIEQQPGLMTGSGFPMPFIDSDGSVLDIYQAATHLVDQSGVPQREGVLFMVRRALGPEQFFGAFGTHYDYHDDYAEVLIQVARQYGVPLISAEQMLAWLDGRNRSRFEQIGWNGYRLRFVVRLATGAERAVVMLPALFGEARFSRVTCAGRPVEFTVQTIKGLDTAFLAARPAACEAVYGPELPMRYMSLHAVKETSGRAVGKLGAQRRE